MRWLPSLSVGRPVTIVMAFLALCVLGVIAYARIPLQMLPDGFVFPSLWVWAPYPDATPQEAQTEVALPIEEHLSTVPGLRSLSSRASASGASFTLEFTRSVDMDTAYNDVADRLERAMADLPEDVERTWIWRWNPSDEPILWMGLRLPEGLEDPYSVLTDVVQKRIERAPGVGKVEAWGVDARRVYIDFSLADLQRNRVNLYELIGKLSSDNFQLASGRITDRGQVRYVRSLARWETLDDLKRFPVKDGVTLDDVATVSYRTVRDLDINHIDGEPGAAVAIYKESGANTVATSKAAVEATKDLEADPRLGGGQFFSFFDQGTLIRGSVDNLLETALWGGLFAFIVLYVFLREWRMTVLIAACMPFTLLMTIIILYFTGRSLNLLSLMGLMLAVGMVVDNAIVVVEAIFSQRQEGVERKQAAIEGTAEVWLAITLSTLTTMVVFLPVILMSEDANFSFFMGALGFPVVFALGASLLVALVFSPLSTTLLRAQRLPPEARWIGGLKGFYARWLRRVLVRRADTLMGALAVGILTIAIPVKSVGCQDEADDALNDFVIRYTVPGTFSYTERGEIVDAFEAVVDENRDRWGVRVHRSRLSADSTNGRTYVYLLDEGERPEGAIPKSEVVDEVKEKLPDLPGVEAEIGWGDDREQSSSLSLVLRGEDTSTLEGLGEEVERRIRTLPGVLTVRSDLEESGGEEMRLRVDRAAAARHGLTAQRIGQTVAFAMRGTSLRELQWGDREVNVVARYSLEDRQDLDVLLDFPLWAPATMSSVPLRAVINPEVSKGYGTIRRSDRTTAYGLTVDLDQDADQGRLRAGIGAVLDSVSFPRGYSWDWGMQMRQDAENDDARALALLLSVVFVFLIMGVLFESLLLPLSILTTIPMALFGVYWTLYLTGTPFDVMGGVGLVILVGVVVNNGIVLIDLVTRLRADGMDRTDALVEAGARRLRPILMTALTTIFGLVPMAVGTASFIGIPYAPLGRVVGGGMVAGTLLTLFFVPFLYAFFDDVRDSGRRWFAWVVGRPVAAGADMSAGTLAAEPAPGRSK